ncbi:MAG: hypothetical protein INH37_26815, partial [Myxococcaceae bacterium]|nr:hypothetical protein [Myxococcaceae bacterium]
MSVRGPRGPKSPFTRYELPGRKQSESRATTKAVGEEGGSKPWKPGGATTKAVGEEGGGKPGKPGKLPDMTTLAVGEEGGGKPGKPGKLP